MPTPTPLLARLNWYWTCQIGGWLLVALFQATLYARMPNVGVVALCTLVGALAVSDAWHRFIKRRGWGSRGVDWRLLACSVFVLSPMMMLIVATAIHVFMRPIDGFAWLPVSLLSWSGTFITWNLLYVMALSLRRANRLEAERLRLELHAKDVELRALQAQVNPHFFFNSLNSVRALIYEDPDGAAQAVDQLAGLMRYALQAGHAHTVPLAAELEAVHCYLAIEKIRFEERLRVRLEIAPGLERVMIPPMALQTLVENAVKYGVEAQPAGSDIHIRACRGAHGAVIEIANTGAIRDGAGATQVGLANTRQRLALSVGAAASLQLSEQGGWVRATLCLPEAA